MIAWLRDAVAATPVAVLLDGLHQADAETLALLETAAAITAHGQVSPDRPR